MESEGQRFKLAREEFHFTLRDVALMTGYSVSTISGVENGHDRPSKRLRQLLTDRLGINEEWLRTGKGQMQRPVTEEEEQKGVWNETNLYSPEEQAIMSDPEMISVINRLRIMTSPDRKRWLKAIHLLLDQLVEHDEHRRAKRGYPKKNATRSGRVPKRDAGAR